MNGFTTWGRRIVAGSTVAFGVLHLVNARSPDNLSILPYTAEGPAAMWAIGAMLVAGGAGVLVPRLRSRAARWLGAALVVDFILVHVPRMVASPLAADVRAIAFETLALGAALLLVAAADAPDAPPVPAWPLTPRTTARLGDALMVVSLVVFGVNHFLLMPLITSLIPAWIPAHGFLAVFTGAGFIAAGLSTATGRLRRAAGVALALMFLIWVAVLHAPRVAEQPDADEWTSMFVAVMMCGAGLVIAGTAARPARAAPAPAAEPPGAARAA